MHDLKIHNPGTLPRIDLTIFACEDNFFSQTNGVVERINGRMHYRVYRILEPLKLESGVARHKDEWIWPKFDKLRSQGAVLNGISLADSESSHGTQGQDGMIDRSYFFVNPTDRT